MRRIAFVVSCFASANHGLRASTQANGPCIDEKQVVDVRSLPQLCIEENQSSRRAWSVKPLKVLASLLLNFSPVDVGRRSSVQRCSPHRAGHLSSVFCLQSRIGCHIQGMAHESDDRNTPAEQTSDKFQRDAGFLSSAIAGGLAACSATVFFHPLDTVKTMLQHGAGSAAVLALGVQGVYRGVVPAALSMMPACAVRMGAYEVLKNMMLHASLLQRVPTSILIFFASACSVIASCSVRAPLDLVKTRVQADDSISALGALQEAWGTGGLSGFCGMYRGAGLALLRDVPFFGFNLLIYEKLKAFVLARKLSARETKVALPPNEAQRGPASATSASDDKLAPDVVLSPLALLIIGFVAQGVAGFLTNPADVLKTRVQAGAAAGMGDALQSTLQEGGPLALMAGAGIRVAWIAPQGCIYYPVYELVLRLLSKRRQWRFWKLLRGLQQRDSKA